MDQIQLINPTKKESAKRYMKIRATVHGLAHFPGNCIGKVSS